MHVLILADGDAPERDALDRAWPGWDDGLGAVVAADGGARHAPGLGVTIDRWVGDGDSLGATAVEALVAAGVRVELSPVDKDASDTELALDAALAIGATRITVVGALGGARLDHALGNLALLSRPDLAGLDVRLVAGDARVSLLSVPAGRDQVHHALPGRIGDLVSLLPVGDDVTGVTTAGLRYPLRDEPLVAGRTRGLSNVRIAPDAEVTIRRGRLLIVEAPATL